MLQGSKFDTHTGIVASALWAAAGDALGWITELVDQAGVTRRAGTTRVRTTIGWKRQIGGRFGFQVELPPGTYSDDTQLRLAVCRAMRGDGSFDSEAFARVELPVWMSYALGAGKASKAAAANLARRDVNWYSNFFGKGEQYLRAGGNGAAMRIQPHVWAVGKTDTGALYLPVFRNAVITHGHPHGFLGAIFHAGALRYAITERETLDFDGIIEVIRSFAIVPGLPERDRHLSSFWIGLWEQHAGKPFAEAIHETAHEALEDLKLIAPLVAEGNPAGYTSILEKLGCFSPKYRGSGLKTAIAASVLSHFFRDDPEGAIITAANALGSDTDSIGTMAGAILGAKCGSFPDMPIQDRDYIATEAARIADISTGKLRDSFIYPDLARFDPPSSQSDAVVSDQGKLVVKGLGQAREVGPAHQSGDAIWQWLELPFGQTIFVKRRARLKENVSSHVLPSARRVISGPAVPGRPSPRFYGGGEQESLFSPREQVPARTVAAKNTPPRRVSINSLVDEVIASNFRDDVIGRTFKQCIDERGDIEGPIAFAAIVAKARISRRPRS